MHHRRPTSRRSFFLSPKAAEVADRLVEPAFALAAIIHAQGRTSFDMGPAPRFTAIRFFTEADGWVGYFTDSGLAERFPRYEGRA